MRQPNVWVVMCDSCKHVMGKVTEVEIDPEKRPGIFKNVCDPNPIPVKCSCGNTLVRM